MTHLEKSNIIDQMIKENSDYTILDYLKLMGELEVIERFTAIIEISKKDIPKNDIFRKVKRSSLAEEKA